MFAARAVQGKCTKPAPSVMGQPPLGPLREGMCLIQIPGTLFQWSPDFASRTVWLDNFYMRLKRGDKASDVQGFVDWNPKPDNSKLFVTNCTMQGDNMPGSNALLVRNSPVMIAGAPPTHGVP